MTFIETIPDAGAPDEAAEVYGSAREAYGYLPNFVEAFSLDVFKAWQQLNGSIKAGADLRRYELATIAAARRLRSSYCMLAHGTVLVDEYLEPEALREIAVDHRTAGLDEVDVAVMDLAEKVVDDATKVNQADFDRLCGLGLSDREIFDVILAAAARCFFSKVLDALGAEPDREFAALDPGLLDALLVGRPLASG